MSRINVSLKHGQTLEEARGSMEKAVEAVRDRFAMMFRARHLER